MNPLAMINLAITFMSLNKGQSAEGKKIIKEGMDVIQTLGNALKDKKVTMAEKKALVKELRELNIGAQVLYIPVHLQPYSREKYGFSLGDFPKAEEYYNRCLCIPIFPSMVDQEVDFVIEGVRSITA